MKKRLLCFLIAVLFVLPLTLTGCDKGEAASTGGRKALTLTLYGITGETTTAEAIKAVENELNEYTEGKFNTHIVLKLYPEDEYYAIIEEKLAENKRIKEEEKKGNKNNKKETTEAAAPAPDTELGTEAETEVDYGANKVVYPAVKGTQIDIFMVQGRSKMIQYEEAGYLSGLSDALSNTTKLISQYIAAEFLTTTTIGGRGLQSGLVDRGVVYGIPNNTVQGEYTYLLVNKELATQYYYSANDVKTLDLLANFLDDAATNHPDYVTLYNEPPLAAVHLTDAPSFIGDMVTPSTYAFTRMTPGNMLSMSSYVSYLDAVRKFTQRGYIVEGDMHSLPEGQKVAAAFIKGDASLPAAYEDEYFVINYAKPMANSDEWPGTMFCVSSYSTGAVERNMEIIQALQTLPAFRNTFQYGVEGVHYTEDEYTGVVKILNDDYSMNPDDTGNLFLLKINDRMSEKELSLAADNWALAKQQYRDTVVNPYTMFDFKVVTAENYKTTSFVYASMYQDALDAAKEAAREEGKKFDASTFEFDAEYPHMYTDVILSELTKLSEEYMEEIMAFEDGRVDESGQPITFKDYLRTLRKEFEDNEYYQAMVDETNPDSPVSQYSKWYTNHGPKLVV